LRALRSTQAELFETDQALELERIERASLSAFQPGAPPLVQRGRLDEQQVQWLAANGRVRGGRNGALDLLTKHQLLTVKGVGG
jgi:hypothetical protein